MKISYQITFSDRNIKEYEILLDDDTLALVAVEKKNYPEWAKLSFHQCPNCELTEDVTPRCPVAQNMSDVIHFAKSLLSYEKVDVKIVTENRVFQKKTSLQSVLSALVGVYMVTSGCPVLDKLRPLVWSHLPFTTVKETTYRVISMYLLAQYFLHKRGRKPDWELRELPKIYDDIKIVNEYFCKRIRDLHLGDAGLNAICVLDNYANFTNMLLKETGLDSIECFFKAYLKS